ncbi:hypothetical protein GF357_01220 [Candidatus Dojkabacteria bacterium]|nr:hypothetical protein [Candidatus Dojkabacteria bacterium]
MKPETRAKISATTQAHLEVQEIVDDLIITKSGKVVLVIQTDAVNFDLLSEYEQDNKIYAFAGLLNSLNFHIQILIRTKRIDISNYVDYLKNQLSREMSPGLRKQLEIYSEFIQNLIVQNDVLDKKFYLVIPFTPVTVSSSPIPIPKSKKRTQKEALSLGTKRSLEQGKIYLYPKRDHLLKQLGRMGLVGHQLVNEELIDLFYEIYNSED